MEVWDCLCLSSASFWQWSQKEFVTGIHIFIPKQEYAFWSDQGLNVCFHILWYKYHFFLCNPDFWRHSQIEGYFTTDQKQTTCRLTVVNLVYITFFQLVADKTCIWFNLVIKRIIFNERRAEWPDFSVRVTILYIQKVLYR